MGNKVSIIIPNYNRAHLIGETLDSIIAQSYPGWECIIVDDGSIDNSLEIINEYSKKDSRFKLYERPEDYPKGANACRNIGLSKATGKYVIFFDSDDLMNISHIQTKVEAIQSGDYDFIVARTKYFNNSEGVNPMNYRELDKLPINADNFIQKKINWTTLDPLIKTGIAKSISFTEKNESAEEYNYFVKLVLATENAIAINDVLSKRRYHEGSYHVNLDSQEKKIKNKFYYFYDTYFEIKNSHISKSSKKYLLNYIAETIYHHRKMLSFNPLFLYKELIKEFGILKGLNKIITIESKNWALKH